MASWAVYSMIGGFVFGALRHTPPTAVLVALLGLFTVPIALVGGGAWWLILALVPAGLLTAPSLASSADAVSRLVPAAARGEAMGLYGSALTLGLAGGAPLAGVVIDAGGPSWGFAVVGGVTLAMALIVLPFARTHAKAEAARAETPAEEPQPVPAGAHP
jgi:MFS family permease